jgi:N-acetylmuramoyl-L-alanine amidase
MLRKISYILLIWLAFVVPANAESSDVTRVSAGRIGGTEERTRFVADIAGNLHYSVQTLSNPDRVAILFKAAEFDLPAGIGQKARGLISELRYGVAEDGQSKIVLLTKAPVRVDQSFLIPGASKQPSRLVVDIVAAAELKAIQPQAQQPENQKVIVIDPGHGGNDPGAVSTSGVMEKTVVLNFARTLKHGLESTGRYRVVLTREDDVFLKLKDRVNIARNAKAGLFLALHADTVRTKTTRGATFYTLSDEASDAEAAALAHKENRADIIAGVELPTENNQVADILIELAQRESASLASDFASKAVNAMADHVLMTGKPLRSAGFTVLRAPDVPSVLVELGYLSNPKDEKLLLDDHWHQNFAGRLVTAIDQHFALELARKEDENAAAASP